MTMKPKASKYRIRRSSTNSAEKSAEPKSPLGGSDEDGFGDTAYPTSSKSGQNVSSDDKAPTEISAIKKEGLTGRQLRMARRVAQKHGLSPSSDFEAVRMLRLKGVDPFKRSTMMELVVSDQPDSDGDDQLPQKATQTKSNVPSTEVMSKDAREAEITKIQQGIAKRRRRKSALLLARLSFFVFLPTAIVGFYFAQIATPLFATKSEFLIQQAEAQGAGALGGLFSGTGFATSQDSITVQSYLKSREAMLRLDTDIGYKSHFSQDFVDPLQRLEIDSTNEKAYKLYEKLVKISYDPTEGIIKMEVAAADPETSRQYSLALIKYAEEQVDNLTQRLREDQMKGARDSFVDAEAKMLEAQMKVLEMQEQLGVIDPVSETAAVMAQVASFETQLQQKTLQLQQLMDNQRPNKARVEGVKGDIGRLETLVASLRSQLTVSTSQNGSLARMTGQLRVAEVDLQTRQLMMQQSLQSLETARIAANRQVRYLSLGVSPVAPDEASYPRAFENTLVALLIFAGLYLMASLTASILREQVSA